MAIISIDKIVRSRRRTLALIVTTDAKLQVRAPWHMSQSVIERFIYSKQQWIIQKQFAAQEKLRFLKPTLFVNGAGFFYLGKHYQLRIEARAAICITTDVLCFPQHLLFNSEIHLTTWYKHMARQKFLERVTMYSDATGIKHASLKISSAKGRWGSCSRIGRLNISWRLIMAPLEVIDYVVVHELVHIVEPNHSQRFWNQVAKILPEYKLAKNWLRHNGVKLQISTCVEPKSEHIQNGAST